MSFSKESFPPRDRTRFSCIAGRLSQWYHRTISSSVAPFSSCPQSFPISGSFPMSWLFASGAQSIGASASVLPMNLQGCFFYDWSPCCPRDSQESSPAPQFENINSLALSFLYGLTLTFIHDNWKSHLLLLFSPSVVSDSLQSHRLQHTRPPCLSLTPGAYSNLCPSSQWCHPTISSSIVPFSHLQSFPASGSFQMSQLFEWGAQRIGVSASTSVFPTNIQDWFLLGWIGWISLQSKGLSRVFSNTTVQKHQFFSAQISL